MEMGLERRHEAREEAAILADGIAGHRGSARRHPARGERQGRGLGARLVERRRLDPLDEAAAAVGRLVPVVHRVEHRVRLVDDPGFALGEDPEIAVGHDDRQLDDAVALWIEPGHLHVDPEQAVGVGLDVVQGGCGRGIGLL